ncbi:restriction endonuclease [Ktedonobacter racemifer]|uniref:Restriction endonuclease n=1 Tax=Ktedonobacter racemifer DSM 44963 TaxID=485913 RepID=D6TLY0_KTERA|nr:restriction endonuclease [Ktedonobacter racemifer]EFH86780.1 restriction endonuclease [Ktedonobacter racemifer DSM 44963]
MTALSQRFEGVTKAILHRLREQFGFVYIEGSKKYPAKDSGVMRQIDVTAYTTEKEQIIVECKLHKSPIDINYIDAFYTVIHIDIGADGGIIISSSGFTDGAIKSASAKRIKLATLNSGATEEQYMLQLDNLICISISETNVGTEEVIAISIPVDPETEQINGKP